MTMHSSAPATAAAAAAPPTGGAAHATAARGGVIEVRVQSIDRLFDPADPSPLGQQDLSRWAAEYIVESVKEMPSPTPCGLEVLAPGPINPSDDAAIGLAVRGFFARHAMLRRRSLHRLLRRGLIMLAIGAAFLAAFFGVSQLVARLLGNGPITSLLREGSLIVGWVAMWKPIEIFLYDWWPIVGERRLYDRLSRIDVRAVPSPPLAQALAGSDAAQNQAARAIERWENEGGRINAEPPPAPLAAGVRSRPSRER
jgi:hypothetical protein